MDDARYLAWRTEIELRFATMRGLDDEAEVHRSPSGRYFLRTTEYTAGPSTWNYSRGVVFREGDPRAIADVKRNYGMFWHAWVQVRGREYLLCGEDYQGYNVIDLDTGVNTLTFPLDAYDGRGFCWVAAHPSPRGETLAVEGCFWACPYEMVLLDFTNPGLSPLPELGRVDDLESVGTWVSNREIQFMVGEGAEKTARTWRRDNNAV